jgi:hypothetical protein
LVGVVRAKDSDAYSTISVGKRLRHIAAKPKTKTSQNQWSAISRRTSPCSGTHANMLESITVRARTTHMVQTWYRTRHTSPESCRDVDSDLRCMRQPRMILRRNAETLSPRSAAASARKAQSSSESQRCTWRVPTGRLDCLCDGGAIALFIRLDGRSVHLSRRPHDVSSRGKPISNGVRGEREPNGSL